MDCGADAAPEGTPTTVTADGGQHAYRAGKSAQGQWAAQPRIGDGADDGRRAIPRRPRPLAPAGIARTVQRPLPRSSLDAFVDGSLRPTRPGVGVRPRRATSRRACRAAALDGVLGGPPPHHPAIPDQRGIVPLRLPVVEGARRYPGAVVA